MIACVVALPLAVAQVSNLDDRDCIQIALLRLPRPEPGNGYPIWLSSSYVKGGREPLGELLTKMSDNMPKRSPQSEIDWVSRAKKSLTASGSYKMPELKPLGEYTWDKKIVVKEVKRDFNRARRVEVAWVHPPSYSADGHWCVVHRGFPWSMHSGERWTLIERGPKGWVYRAQLELIYP